MVAPEKGYWWIGTIGGRLAEIIVMDQFSRNLMRNDIRTYTQDRMAIALAQEALSHPDYDALTVDESDTCCCPLCIRIHGTSSLGDLH